MQRRRRQRLDDLMRKEISEILLREIQDPRVELVSVVRVALNKDSTVARVFVSPVLADEASRRACVEGLTSARGRIRFLLGERLDLRHMPELRFVMDDSIEQGDRILSLLEEVREQLEPPEDA